LKTAVGFDTSCYTTSVAACDENGEIIASYRKLLFVPPAQNGLRQSEAVFAHLKQLPELAEKLKAEIGSAEIRAVAASVTPRDAQDSYMPVFTVGKNFGSSLASLLGVPFFAASHQLGHILAGKIGNPPMREPFVAVHLSGGTTESLLCEGDTLTKLGQSLDIHAGQLLDRLGVLMGFPFPAGAALETLAMREKAAALLPASMGNGGLDCHLSGAETQCRRWLESGEYQNERIAAEAFDFLARTVARMIAAACERTDAPQVLIVGGVASSQLLREQIPRRLQKLGCDADAVFGRREYAADNAAGIARYGMRKYLESEGLPCSY
jgi:N6-L-threonylcarbamoyladenine synthase